VVEKQNPSSEKREIIAASDEPYPVKWYRSFKKVGALGLLALLAYPIVIFSLAAFGFYDRSTTAKRSQDCIERNGERKVIQGTVRQAGPSFFVQENDWHVITHICSGKGSYRCYQNNPGIAVLERSIGKPVTVEFCEGDVISYTVAGSKYTK
jgi:hypothetical protein